MTSSKHNKIGFEGMMATKRVGSGCSPGIGAMTSMSFSLIDISGGAGPSGSITLI